MRHGLGIGFKDQLDQMDEHKFEVALDRVKLGSPALLDLLSHILDI